ncbi:hypothetical protein Lal_00031637 [Lupinus albus]|nr:hypothetical protein Lal_00031637 [Lupinus albus]
MSRASNMGYERGERIEHFQGLGALILVQELEKRVSILRMERVCGLIQENPKNPKEKMWLEWKMDKMLEVEDEFTI